MNYLAHLCLSPDDDLSRLGNIMGDFTRDLDREKLPGPVLTGIQMHQSVDGFTDSHPVVRGLRKKFSKDRRRFSGVVLDVVFDHFLIKHWHSFMDVELDDFVNDCYHSLWQNRTLMPDRMEMVVGWMISRNWIKTYTELEGVGRALDGLAGRLKIKHNFHGSISEVKQMYSTIELGFLEFFPELNEHSQSFLENTDQGLDIS